jgi:hypothetical protein
VSLPKLHEIISTLIRKTGEKSYLSEYKFIRELKGSSIVKLKFTDLTNNDVKFNSANCLFKLGPGTVELSDLSIDSSIAQISNLDFKLDARSLKPDINLRVQADQLDLNAIKAVYDQIYNKNIDNTSASSPPDKSQKWNSTKFNIFRFDRFSGSLNLDLKNFSLEALHMNELQLQGNIKEDVLFIDNLMVKWI